VPEVRTKTEMPRLTKQEDTENDLRVLKVKTLSREHARIVTETKALEEGQSSSS
jgi:hypothetical protein